MKEMKADINIKKFAALIFALMLILNISACVSPENKTESAKSAVEDISENIKNEGNDMNDISKDKKSFKVDGIKIISPDGGEFLVKGVNTNGPGWVFERDTLQDVDLITGVWQFNTIRLCAAIGWEWAVNNNKDLDAIIKAFTDKNIVVILEVHDYTGIYPPLDDVGYRSENVKYVYPIGTLKEWWVDKAERFKDNSYVWFNIMNEPGDNNSKESADSWFNIHAEVIEAIRNTGAENIIVLDEHGWGQGSGYYGGKDSYDSAIIRMGPELNKKYDNLVYSLHVYDAWRDGKSRFDSYFKDARELDLCVILGEYGVGKDSISQHSAVKAMFNSAIENNIGRIYWAWDDSFPLTFIGKGAGWTIETEKTDGEKPDNLTWIGELIWLDNRGLLNAPVPEYNLTLPLLPNGDFEDGMTGWQDWAQSSVKDGESYNGSKTLIVGDGGSGGAGRSIELKPDTSYSFSAWGKANKKTNSGIDVGVKFRDSENPEAEQHYFVTFTETEWTQKSMTFITPGDFSGETLFIWKNAENISFYIDDLELIELTGLE